MDANSLLCLDEAVLIRGEQLLFPRNSDARAKGITTPSGGSFLRFVSSLLESRAPLLANYTAGGTFLTTRAGSADTF